MASGHVTRHALRQRCASGEAANRSYANYAARRCRSVDAGFMLRDHVDWPQLRGAVAATGAERVWVTHGFTGPVVRWLTERGLDARAIATRWEGERDDAAVDATEVDDVTPTTADVAAPA
jgi:putative mRNA 3-end processing factor